MGNSLDKPITEKDTCTGSSSLVSLSAANEKPNHVEKCHRHNNNKTREKVSENTTNNNPNPLLLNYGASSMQGWRIDMEDAHICCPQLSMNPPTMPPTNPPSTLTNHPSNYNNNSNLQLPLLSSPPSSSSGTSSNMLPPDHSLFCVFDGHGGSEAAKYASDHFTRVLSENQYFQEYVKFIMPYLNVVVDTSATKASKSKKEKRAQKKQAEAAKSIPKPPSTEILDTCKTLLKLALQHAFVQLDHDLLIKQIHDQNVTVINSKNEKKKKNDNNTTDDWDFDFCTSRNKDTLVQSPKTHEYDPHRDQTTDPATTTSTAANAATGGAVETTSTSTPTTGAGNLCPGLGDQISWEEDGFLEDDPGTTGVAVLITPHVIVCANLGDSRAVLCSTGDNDYDNAQTVLAKPLSFDHKPTNEAEKQRIEDTGGTINFGRVDGELAVSRAIGDFNLKDPQNKILLPQDQQQQDTLDDEEILERAQTQKVSSVPDIEFHTRQLDTDRFVVLACDGIWDVLSNQECVELISNNYFDKREYNVGVVCEEVLDICLKKGSRDNMTIVIVTFPPVVTARV